MPAEPDDTADDTAADTAARLRRLLDRADVVDLLDSYVGALDRQRHTDSWLESVFTEDAVVAFPMGTYVGIDGLRSFQELARTTFARTHHSSTNHRVDPDPDDPARATATAHLQAVHLPDAHDRTEHFAIGGHYTARVVRTARGWRIARFDFDLVWTRGTPPGSNEHAR
ncbi:nuclear transport factor 2 family protein [Pseudonocardia nematodicida]|uniref:Nuclear transport factor 2 family protein n=1 Tax=Pseudonocardia nematodicida TaxID=1206997 RepID=A0ABV1KEB0_9PSEU